MQRDQKKRHILSFPTQMSFRSFTFASTPIEHTALMTTSAVAWRSKDALGRCIEKLVFPKSCTFLPHERARTGTLP